MAAYTKEALERSRKRPKLEMATIVSMVNDYDAGMPIRALAKRYGYSYTGMHTILFNAGVKFRKAGGMSPALKEMQKARKARKAAK